MVPNDAAKRLMPDVCGAVRTGLKGRAANIVFDDSKDVEARGEAGTIGQGFRNEGSLATTLIGVAGQRYHDFSGARRISLPGHLHRIPWPMQWILSMVRQSRRRRQTK